MARTIGTATAEFGAGKSVRIFQEVDYVFAHTDYKFFGPKMDSDLFRFENEKIVEHWNNLQEKPAGPNLSGHTTTDGPTEAQDLDRTEQNKAFVRQFFEAPAMPSSTPMPLISREKAIEFAINGCKHPHLVLIGDPTNIQAKQMTLEEADKLTRAEGETTNYEEPLDTKVWFVQMDGRLQLVGGPQPVITLDSQTGTPTPLFSPFLVMKNPRF